MPSTEGSDEIQALDACRIGSREMMTGEICASVHDDGVWIEIENMDPVEGALEWAHISPECARKLISEIQACLREIDTP